MPAVKRNPGNESLRKFQDLLRELFQFDCADLDFGIYRVMNYKRDAIERFISDELPRTIREELQSGGLADRTQIAKKLEDVRTRILEGLGQTAVDADGNLDKRFWETPLGKEYLLLQARTNRGLSGEALESSILNHLYSFFSRYYEDGDYISKRRYSRRQRYAIPYNGEDVYLHWANNDQYYIKTAEYFHDYSYKAPNGVTVQFKLKAADVEQNNVKGDKRFFLPQSREIVWDNEGQTIVIPFEYRPLTNQESLNYGNKKQQEEIISETLKQVPKNLKALPDALAALMGERRVDLDGQSITFLEHHLRHYTVRNTSDFFIHKSLRGFLSRELDFYLKNEVLNLDEVEAAGEDHAEGWFQTMQVIRSVAGQIISFLDQIESFQKMLWEKRKFVTETHYCVRVGIIDESFYPDVVVCDAQWEEWKNLFGIDEEEPNLFNLGKDRAGKRIDYLRNHPALVLDTKHFGRDFVDRLLTIFDDLDGMTDGLLLHSENWQALNLLKEKYANSCQSIYIDPPYNTAGSEIIYKNAYKHSSWLTFMANRLLKASSFLDKNAAWVVAIDDTEMVVLSQLLDSIFPVYDRNMVVVNHHSAGSGLEGTNVSSTHEYAIFMSPKGVKVLRGEKKSEGYQEIGFIRTGTAESNLRSGRPNSFYAFLVDPSTSEIIGVEHPPASGETYPKEETQEGFIRIYPLSNDGTERVWRRSYKTIHTCLKRGEVICRNCKSIYLVTDQTGKSRPLFSNWTDKKYNAGQHGTNLLKKLFGNAAVFSYPKSINTVHDCIDACTQDMTNATILDYFAGSGTTGHAVINLNRKDGGQRKFILVEMGEYFTTVLVPRIKKTIFSPEWKDGKPERVATSEEVESSPRIVKYQRIESYEDTLNNIEFEDAAGQHAFRFDDYLIQYMLKWETKQSATLLNVENLSRPFSYKLLVHSDGEIRETVADIPETFNYLLGLRVRTRRAYDDAGRRYLVYGCKNREESNVTMIWRETEGWEKEDYVRDRNFVAELGLASEADEVFVNGDSLIPGAKALEPLFKSRMFAGVDT